MRRQQIPSSAMLLLVALLMLVATACALTSPQQVIPQQHVHHQQQHTTTSTRLYSVIRGDDFDAEVDVGRGGVRLAEESVIKITGEVKHKPGSADPKPMELVRHTRFRDVSADKVEAAAFKIVCTGRGVENYKDPGSGTAAEVILAPLDAVRDAMMAAGTTQDAEKLVINFLGGDDLQMLEVLDAVEQLVLNLDVKTSTKISFNSICHSSFPADQAYLTVVALTGSASAAGSDGSDDGEGTTTTTTLRGEDRSLAEGEVYFQDGKYYTVVKEDINAAVA